MHFLNLIFLVLLSHTSDSVSHHVRRQMYFNIPNTETTEKKYEPKPETHKWTAKIIELINKWKKKSNEEAINTQSQGIDMEYLGRSQEGLDNLETIMHLIQKNYNAKKRQERMKKVEIPGFRIYYISNPEILEKYKRSLKVSRSLSNSENDGHYNGDIKTNIGNMRKMASILVNKENKTAESDVSSEVSEKEMKETAEETDAPNEDDSTNTVIQSTSETIPETLKHDSYETAQDKEKIYQNQKSEREYTQEKQTTNDISIRKSDRRSGEILDKITKLPQGDGNFHKGWDSKQGKQDDWDKPQKRDDEDKPKKKKNERPYGDDWKKPLKSNWNDEDKFKKIDDWDKPKVKNDWDKPKKNNEEWDRPKNTMNDWDRPKKKYDDWDRPKKKYDDWDRPKKKYDDWDSPKKSWNKPSKTRGSYERQGKNKWNNDWKPSKNNRNRDWNSAKSYDTYKSNPHKVVRSGGFGFGNTPIPVRGKKKNIYYDDY